MVGRPCSKVELNFNQIDKSVELIKTLIVSHSTKQKVERFAQALNSVLFESTDIACQTSEKDSSHAGCQTDAIQSSSNAGCQTDDIDSSHSCSDDTILNSIDSLYQKLPEEDKLVCSFVLFEDLQSQSQVEYFEVLGKLFNKSLYEQSKENIKKTNNITFDEMSYASKKSFFESADPRIQAFFTSMTQKTSKDTARTSDNINYLSNAYENLLKARNKCSVSIQGAREGVTAYICSNRSKTTSTIMSKQGAKGSMPLLKKIIENTAAQNAFTPPPDCMIMLSFDNIQRLQKSYHITSTNIDKPLAIVVTSALCTLPDGFKMNRLQYDPNYAPSKWHTSYQINEKSKCLNNNLDTEVLKMIATDDDKDEKVIKQYFDHDLMKAISTVEKETVYNEEYENYQDSIDIVSKKVIQQNKKVCTKGHINIIKRSYQKKCKVGDCRELLVNKQKEVSDKEKELPAPAEKESAEKLRADHYMNVTCIENEENPVEIPMGCFSINPNNAKRVKVILDKLILKAGVEKDAVKIKVDDNGASKIVSDSDKNQRKWILITCDGLPYKLILSIMQNNHTCCECGKKLKFVSEISEHMNASGHNLFYQTYGSIILNSGHFHYMLALSRTYTKLIWHIYGEELAKSINLDSSKALYMLEKVTNLRKFQDFIRTCRKAILEELVTPFVRYALDTKVQLTIENFEQWMKTLVKSETYITIYQLEKHFGTALLLFYSSMRANNYDKLQVAKRTLSPLFHINGNFNYSVIDVQTDYMSRKMKLEAPALYDYLKDKLFTNKTGKPYSSEPLDERHEEYNKRGLSFQDMRSTEHFQTGFLVCDSFAKLQKSCLEDYGLKTSNDHLHRPTQYEGNIRKMREHMRSKSFLSKPENKKKVTSLNETFIEKKILNVVEIAKTARRSNIMQVIKKNDMFCPFNTEKFDIFTKQKTKNNLDEEIQILISCESDVSSQLALYSYWQESKKKKSFQKEKFIEDILSKNFQF